MAGAQLVFPLVVLNKNAHVPTTIALYQLSLKAGCTWGALWVVKIYPQTGKSLSGEQVLRMYRALGLIPNTKINKPSSIPNPHQ